MPKRISQHSKLKGLGARVFSPDLKEWKKACKIYAYDSQIFKHFDICKETFYSFLDKQRYAQEQGESAVFLDAYKRERSKTKQQVLDKLLKSSETAANIFAAKTYGGLIETKDIKLIEIRKKDSELKDKQFLTQLAEKFNLNQEQLQKFAESYFKPVELE